MFDLTLKGLLLLSPIAYGTNVSLDLFDMIFFRIGIIALFIAALWDKPKREIDKVTSLSIVSLLGLGLINLFWHNFAAQPMREYLNLFFACLALVLIIRYTKNLQDCYKWIVYAGFINIGVFLLQKINVNLILNISGDITQRGGILGNAQRLTIYLGLICALSNWLAIGALIVSLITKQYSLFLALWAITFIKLSGKRKKVLWTILLAIGAIFAKDKILYSLNFRWENIWYLAIFEFFRRPLLGYGLGVIPIKGEFLMNSYLQIVCGLGIMVLVWFAYIFKNYWRDFIRNNKESLTILSLIILMAIEYPMEIPRLWLTITFIIGAFIIANIKEAQYAGSL